jgi:hypothetical protein
VTLRTGSIVRIDTGTKVGRPGVVLRVNPENGYVLVAWGTGTLRTHLRLVAVVPRESAGVALGLSKPTYFYAMNAWDGPPTSERLDEQSGMCPRYLLVALRALVGA